MQKITRATLAALGLLPFSLFADNSKLDSTDVVRDSRVIAELKQGKKTGGFIDGMVPFYGNDNHLWFANIQAYKYGDESQTYGLGIGHRAIVKDAIYGVYGFYDWQQSENKKNYGRVSLGIERLTKTWDVRANFNYYVFKDKNNLVDEGIQSSYIQGNDIFNRHFYDAEKIHSGASAEVGRTLGLQRLRGYVGGYTYGGKINGYSARLQYQLTDKITFTANGQHDSERGWLATGGVQYWMGSSPQSGKQFNLADRLRDPIIRDMTLPTTLDFDHMEIEKDPRSIYFANPNSTIADGTQADPTTLSDAIAKAGENDYIYLMYGDGNDFALTDNVTLKNGQILWGNSSNLYIDGRLLLQGDANARPNISGGGINLANNNTINGVKFTGTNNQYAIFGDGVSNATLNDIEVRGDFSAEGGFAIGMLQVNGANLSAINIDATGESAIAMRDSTAINITHSAIAGTYSSDAIAMEGTTGSISASNIDVTAGAAIHLIDNSPVSLSDITINGVYTGPIIDIIDTANAGAVVNNLMINATSPTAINVNNASGWTFSGLQLSGSHAEDVMTINNSSNITVSDSSISNAIEGKNGVNILGGSTGIVVDSLHLTGSYATAGVAISGLNTQATIQNNSTIVNGKDDAVLVYDGGNAILNNSTFTSVEDYALRVRASNGGAPSSATVTGSHFKDSGQHGVFVEEGSSLTLMDSILSGNTFDGLSVENANSTVTLLGNNVITGNGRYGIFASDNASVDMTGGSIYLNNAYAIQVQSNAIVSVINPTRLEGIIREAGAGTQRITVTVGETSYVVNEGDPDLTCDINDGAGTCT